MTEYIAELIARFSAEFRALQERGQLWICDDGRGCLLVEWHPRGREKPGGFLQARVRYLPMMNRTDLASHASLQAHVLAAGADQYLKAGEPVPADVVPGRHTVVLKGGPADGQAVEVSTDCPFIRVAWRPQVPDRFDPDAPRPGAPEAHQYEPDGTYIGPEFVRPPQMKFSDPATRPDDPGLLNPMKGQKKEPT